jgi:hypothetical protein
MQIIQAVIGAALLAFGRKGLGLFLAALGAMVGVVLANMYIASTSNGTTIVAMIVGGVVGLIAAFFVQKVAVVLAGILGGGYAGYAIATTMGWVHQGFPWVPVIICAVIGIILAHMILKWALIILSSVAGAFFFVGAFELSTSTATALFVLLAAGGIWFQASSGTPRKREE